VTQRRLVRLARTAALGAFAVAIAGGAAAARPTAPRLHGPISDFWNQVKRDWAHAIPGLRTGPSQTFEWVSLVYDSEGEDAGLDDLLEREMRSWAASQNRNWIRSQFWKRRYDRVDRDSFYGSRALRKNLVVMGTPAGNPMLAEMADGTPFRLSADEIEIDGRHYHGPSLVLAFIRPNPFNPGAYALAFAATSSEALLDLGRLPLGTTDYVLLRGANPIEAGYLDWTVPGRVTMGVEHEIFPDHQGWLQVEEAGVVVRFAPAEVREDEARRFALERAAALERVRKAFGLAAAPPIEEYLYPTADEKLRQTGSADPVTVDLIAGSVHRVWRMGDDAPAWPEALVALWRAWGPTDLRGWLEGVALQADPSLEGRTLAEWAARLAETKRLPAMEDLLAGGESRDGTDHLGALGVGAFVARLEERFGPGAVEAYTRAARRLSYRQAFRDTFGTSIGAVEQEWRGRLASSSASAETGGAPRGAAAREAARGLAALAEGEALFMARDDAAAGERLRAAIGLDPGLARAHLLLARLAFRGGRDREALSEAAVALGLAAGDAWVTSWARATLGRAHAALGEIASARLELTDPALDAGPAEPRHLAALWLDNLGLGVSRAAAARALARQADLDLQRSDWDEAERKVLRILAADPGDERAHHQLARVRLEKFRYWYSFANLYNELFPATDPSDPFQYFHLVQSSERESAVGAELAAGDLSPLSPEGGDPDKWIEPTRTPGPGEFSESELLVLQGRGAFVAGDCARATSQLRAALALALPVSDTRASALLMLGVCEGRQGEPAAAREHLLEARRITRQSRLQGEIDAALATLTP
jgi:Tfp pilus assembly protein PilF